MKPLALAAVLLLACTSCGDGERVEGIGDPVGTAYDGPLHVEGKGGAARRVVVCDGPVAAGGTSGELYDDGGAYDTAEEALRESGGGFVFDGVDSGLLPARVEDDRVLFTFDVDGVTKQAVVVHDGPTVSNSGWYVESWARCDLAELPAAVAEAAGTQLWSDADDRPVDTRTLASYRGPEHCDWQRSTFLYLGDSVFVRSPPAGTVGDFFAEDWDADTTLPHDAVDTGYHRGDAHLWLSADERRAYVVEGGGVELWPVETQPLGCD